MYKEPPVRRPLPIMNPVDIAVIGVIVFCVILGSAAAFFIPWRERQRQQKAVKVAATTIV